MKPLYKKLLRQNQQRSKKLLAALVHECRISERDIRYSISGALAALGTAEMDPERINDYVSWAKNQRIPLHRRLIRDYGILLGKKDIWHRRHGRNIHGIISDVRHRNILRSQDAPVIPDHTKS